MMATTTTKTTTNTNTSTIRQCVLKVRLDLLHDRHKNFEN